MRLSLFSALEHRLEQANGATYEVFENPRTGYRSRWRATAAGTDDDLAPHVGVLEDPGDQSLVAPNSLLLGFLLRFVPDESFRFTPLSADELVDRYPWSHTTGPSNRRWIAPALRFALSADPTRQTKGLAALVGFCESQRNRPLAHAPPFRVGTDNFVNAGTPEKWHADDRVPDPKTGWNMGDVAHDDLSIFAAAAALGLDVGYEMLFMRARWLQRGHQGGDHWWNQQRAEAWTLLRDLWMELAGFAGADVVIRVTYFGGKRPKEILRGHLQQYLERPFDQPVAGNPDSRVMAVLRGGRYVGPSGVDYGVQIHGEYSWGKGMRATAGALLLAAPGVLHGGLRDRLTWRVDAEVAKCVDWYAGPGGIAWAAGKDALSPADADDLLMKIVAQETQDGTIAWPRTRPYERHPSHQQPDAGEVIRERPIAQDAGLSLLGWILVRGATDASVASVVAACPKPGNKSYDVRTMDAVHALLAAETAP